MILKEIPIEAKKHLKGKWNKIAMIFLVYYILYFAIMSLNFLKEYSGQVIFLIISGSIMISLCRIYFAVINNDDFDLNDLFYGFRYFVKAFCATILVTIYVLLWTLLLIVPGIIAGLSYSMVYFIITEHPEIGVSEALRQSKAMMKGHKWELFLLHLTFIGWTVLGILSLGIGLLWIAPYIGVSVAVFYNKIRPVENTQSDNESEDHYDYNEIDKDD